MSAGEPLPDVSRVLVKPASTTLAHKLLTEGWKKARPGVLSPPFQTSHDARAFAGVLTEHGFQAEVA